MNHPLPKPVDRRRDALAGLRVLDFTIVMSGPMCTRMLADAGADVVKVEAPGGDVVRQREPVRGGISTYYASMNCGKRSIVLDLQTDEGKRLARELAAQVDIVEARLIEVSLVVFPAYESARVSQVAATDSPAFGIDPRVVRFRLALQEH
jgi:hypothetical protein